MGPSGKGTEKVTAEEDLEEVKEWVRKDVNVPGEGTASVKVLRQKHS